MQLLKIAFLFLFGVAVGYGLNQYQQVPCEVCTSPEPLAQSLPQIPRIPQIPKVPTVPGTNDMVDTKSIPFSYRTVILFQNPLNPNQMLGRIVLSNGPLPVNLVSCYTQQTGTFQNLTPAESNKCLYLGPIVKGPRGESLGHSIFHDKPPASTGIGVQPKPF